MRGSLIITFIEDIVGDFVDFYNVYVNGEHRDLSYTKSTKLYSTYLYIGDNVTITLTTPPYIQKTIDVNRIDYTTDNENSDNGIKTTYISGTTESVLSGLTLSFIVSTLSSSYDFEYRINCTTEELFYLLTELDDPILNEASDNIEVEH